MVEQDPGKAGTEQKRCDHPGYRNSDAAFQALGDDVHAELHADDEHVQRQSELRGWKEIARGVTELLRLVPWEQPLLPFRSQQAKQRGAEQHPGDHLSHDLRLAKTCRDSPHHPAGEQDDGDLEKELDSE